MNMATTFFAHDLESMVIRKVGALPDFTQNMQNNASPEVKDQDQPYFDELQPAYQTFLNKYSPAPTASFKP
ncbi:MAG: hypothetical protein V4496_00970 [Pseudomonadota bacterium]